MTDSTHVATILGGLTITPIDVPSLITNAGSIAIGIIGVMAALKARTDSMRDRLHGMQVEHLKTFIPILYRTISITVEAPRGDRAKAKEFKREHLKVMEELFEAVVLSMALYSAKTYTAIMAYVKELHQFNMSDEPMTKQVDDSLTTRITEVLNAMRRELGVDKLNEEATNLFKTRGPVG